MTPKEALQKAVEGLGGQTAMARICGPRVKQQHVYNWLNRDDGLPEKYAVRVHRACAEKGLDVCAWHLCPEAFSEGDIAA